MSQTRNLLMTVNGTLNGSGNGSLFTGPMLPGVIWLPTSVSISMSGSIPTGSTPATCTLSTGPALTALTFVDATYQVNGAASGIISGQQLYAGTYIYAVWANGNAGATISMTISGTVQVP